MMITPNVAQLRDRANLSIPKAFSSLETALFIAKYVHELFDHNGDTYPSRSDPLTIFNEATSGANFRCVEYSHLAAWLMVAHGIEARTINIMMKDVETMDYGAGHVVVEFYDKGRHGWVMADIQAGVVAKKDSALQSAYELRGSIDAATIENFEGTPFAEPKGMFDGDYKAWLKPYLYFFDRPPQLHWDYSVDPEPHLIIVPDGDEPPKYFQRTHELDLIVVKPIVFYQKPY